VLRLIVLTVGRARRAVGARRHRFGV